jgi:NAD(P)-dependent dehydrogenase (short-subunit alcohol dehydrogenase family)
MMDLQDKVAVVTGGGMGIGQAIALTFAQAGAHICILDIQAQVAKETAAQIEDLGREILISETDVTDIPAVDRAVNKILKKYGRIDILVNNAGITHPAVSIVDLDLEFLDKVTDVDWKGVYICSRRVGKEMIEQKSGCIINISSITALVSVPLAVYAPIKSAIIMFTQVLARDLATHGIRVNAIAPGYVLTPLLQGMFDSGLRNPATLLNGIPMKKWVMPSDVADAAVFLCSEKARCITGVTLPVDAGFAVEGGWKAYGYE